MTRTNLTLFGCEARLILDLDGEDHDVSHLLRQVTTSETPGWTLDASALVNEIQIERRARERAS